MTLQMSDKGPAYGIAAVERDTGLSKDTLRVWERRYGFPQPARDANDERLYSQDELDKLRLIRHLMDHGRRPGTLMGLDREALERLIEQSAGPREPPPPMRELLSLLLAHDIDRLRDRLLQLLMKQGLQRFIIDTVAPFNYWLGEGWLRGEVAVFDEHLYSEHIQNILRNAIIAQPGRGSTPRVLLTSLPGEKHRIGLLMVEALLTLEGARCVALGAETPVIDIRRAVEAYEVDIVALSFSAATSTSAAIAGLRELRALLPADTAVWAGGSGVARSRKTVPGVSLLRSLDQLQQALMDWRAAADADSPHPIPKPS
jgi:DNA-binding transcriptional MerR regulator/methylmalonyl-CoA mutase cobalamin-binding subunit